MQLSIIAAAIIVVGALALVAGVAVLRKRRRRMRRRMASVMLPDRDDDDGPLAQLFVPPGLASPRTEARFRAMGDAAPVVPGLNGGVSYPAWSGGGLPYFGTAAAAPMAAPMAAPPAAPEAQPALAPAQPAVSEPAPADQTLHILPGRLEVLAGLDRSEEIRFVRLPGRAPSLTLGRGEGETYVHVQLDAPTVSRRHAALHLLGHRWHLENLSETNPVLLNGAAVAGPPVPLTDGDTLELGEVMFRFRER